MASIYGIDVSEHNAKLDWSKIKASGIKFAIIRTGYGKGYTDAQFHANMKGALAQGIPVGVYHFSYALNTAGAKKEAEFMLSLLSDYKGKITLPVFFDFEYDTVDYAKKQGVTLGKQAFNDHTVAFCEAVKAAGYTPGVYYNLDYKNRFVDASRLGDYVQWYAQYNKTASWTGYDLWQYSSSHTINGISGRFDINVADESFIATAPASSQPKKSITEIAKEVIAGKWYNGEERRAALEAAGYDYQAVQDEVNRLYDAEKSAATDSGTESPQFFDATKKNGVKYKVKANGGLNMRAGAGAANPKTGKENRIISTLDNGSIVWWYGYYSTVNGTDWYWVKAANGKTGFVSSKYLTA